MRDKIVIINKLDARDAWYDERKLFLGKKMRIDARGYYHFVNKRDIAAAKTHGYPNRFYFSKFAYPVQYEPCR